AWRFGGAARRRAARHGAEEDYPAAAGQSLRTMVRMLFMDYQVELEVFRGPLDLLLFLVRRNEVDICNIPIARIADQFKQYLDVMEFIDVELTGDFLVMASTLMEIKSRMLLPRSETAEEDEADPRQELVRQLI